MAGFEKVAEWVPIDCPDYLFEVEEYRNASDQQMLFVHLHVWKWSLSVLKNLKRTFALFRECVPGPLYTAGTADDDKFHRFVTLFGWQPLTDIPCTDGKTRRLFIHTKTRTKTNVFQIERDAAANVEPIDASAVVRAVAVPSDGLPAGTERL